MAECWDDAFIDISKSHVASISVESPNRISVMVFGDETWGDFWYDLWLKNGETADECISD